MKVIMLHGDSNRGKTTALVLVYQAVLLAGGVVTWKRSLGGGVNDFQAIVSFMGRQIVFFTMGDSSNPLCNAMRLYAGRGIDTFVCACNTKLVKPPRLAATFRPHHILSKTVVLVANSALQASANAADASAILRHLP